MSIRLGAPTATVLQFSGRMTRAHADGSQTWVSSTVYRTSAFAANGRDCNEWRLYTDQYGVQRVIPEHIAAP